MIFGRKKKERVEEREQITNNQFNKFHIEQFKAESKNKAYMDYKDALQKLVNEIVSEDLIENTRNGLHSKSKN